MCAQGLGHWLLLGALSSFHLLFITTLAVSLAESYLLCMHDLEAWCSVSSCCLQRPCGLGAHLCLDLWFPAEAVLDWVLF